MTAARLVLPPKLDRSIETAINNSRAPFDALIAGSRDLLRGGRLQHLALKFVPSKYAAGYQRPNDGLYISGSNLTWGRGVYVVPLSAPLSTAIYGRAGVVARFDPAHWRVFDARTAGNRELYLEWLKVQPTYEDALLTVHSELWLNRFRDMFREQFKIDCVIFHPDEVDSMGWYTRPTDTWLTVSEWRRNTSPRVSPSSSTTSDLSSSLRRSSRRTSQLSPDHRSSPLAGANRRGVIFRSPVSATLTTGAKSFECDREPCFPSR